MWKMKWQLLNEIPREGEGAGGAGGGSEGAGGDTGAGAEGQGTTPSPEPSALSGEDTQAGGQDTQAGGGQDSQAGGGEAEAEVEAFDVAKLTLPEGFELPEELGGEFTKLVNGEMSPQERGQALLDLYVKQVEDQAKAGAEAGAKAWADLNAQWRDEIKALPEFAGKVDEELGATKQALLAAGATPEFFKALDLTGAGNNSHIVQMFHKLTQHLREGKGVSGGAKPMSARSAASIMYPSMNAKE